MLYAYGDRAIPVWLKKHDIALSRLDRLSILRVLDADMQALAGALRPGATLQCTITEGEALLVSGDSSFTVTPRNLSIHS